MNKQPKAIQFVSWKKHKLDQALKQVDGVYNDFVDEITFKTVIDFFRKELGFPKSLSVNELIANEPIVPPFPYKDLMLDSAPLPRRQVCPVCKEDRCSTFYQSSCW